MSDFNAHVQLDFFFIVEIDEHPIINKTDTHSAYSETDPLSIREMEQVAKAFEQVWINRHVNPTLVSGDVEFLNKTFKQGLSEFCTKFQAHLARRDNKLGVVETKNGIIRNLALRISSDADFFRHNHQKDYNKAELMSRATFISKIIYENKLLSSSKMARGYIQALYCLQQYKIKNDLLEAFEAQKAR